MAYTTEELKTLAKQAAEQGATAQDIARFISQEGISAEQAADVYNVDPLQISAGLSAFGSGASSEDIIKSGLAVAGKQAGDTQVTVRKTAGGRPSPGKTTSGIEPRRTETRSTVEEDGTITTTGMLQPRPKPVSTFETLFTKAQQGDMDAFSRLLLGLESTGKDLTGLKPYMEGLATQAGGVLGLDPYNTLVGGTAGAMVYKDLLKAIEEGNTQRVIDLQGIMSQGSNAQLDYITQTYGEGTAHKIAQEKLGFPFGIGPAGKFNNAGINAVDKYVFDDFLGITDDSGGLIGSIDKFFEDPIEALDRWKDMPSAQIAAAVAGAVLGSPGTAIKSGAAAVAALNAGRTLDSGESLSPGQLLALAMSAGTYLDWLGFGEAATVNTAAMENAGLDIQPTNVEQTVGELQTLAEKGGEVYKFISEPVSTSVNIALDKVFGGADALIAKAGSYASDEFVQGLASGLTSAAISEVTGEGKPILKFFEELKGTEILEDFVPDLPAGNLKEYLQVASEAAAGFEDWAREQGLDPGVVTRELAQAEDWLKSKGLDPGVITKELAGLEDWAKQNINLSGVEDWLVQTGDEIATVVDDIIPDLDIPSVELADIGSGGSPMVTMAELQGPQFTPSGRRQGGLAVDTDYLVDEPLLSLQVLQQPTPVRKTS